MISTSLQFQVSIKEYTHVDITEMILKPNDTNLSAEKKYYYADIFCNHVKGFTFATLCMLAILMFQIYEECKNFTMCGMLCMCESSSGCEGKLKNISATQNCGDSWFSVSESDDRFVGKYFIKISVEKNLGWKVILFSSLDLIESITLEFYKYKLRLKKQCEISQRQF